MTFRTARHLPLLMTALLAACASPQSALRSAPPTSEATGAQQTVRVGIIALNDFHGALEPPKLAVEVKQADGSMLPVPAGGGAWLASAVDSLKARHPNNVVVAAGDLTSASQLTSALYLDEPAVGVLNRIGLEFNAVGNHEFDRGWKELQRLQNGGCEVNSKNAPCQLEPFTGANYKYLSASTFKESDGTTLFPATGLKSFGTGVNKVTVGFIGLSLKDVPSLVSPEQVKGLRFGDEAEAINKAVPQLKAQGADAVVVMIHQGGTTPLGQPNGCDGMTGEITPILDRLNSGVDVVVSGHTHWAYICNYKPTNGGQPILLTSAGSYGSLVTDITLDINPKTKKVVSSQAHNVIVQSQPFTAKSGLVANTPAFPQFSPREDIATYIQKYKDAAVSLINRNVGKVSQGATRFEAPSPKPTAGGTLGNMVADAHLAATLKHGAQIAFINPFGVRAPLQPDADGNVTFGQLYAVLPFTNDLVTMTMTGAQIRSVIEDGLASVSRPQALAPSADLHFAFDMARPSGSRVTSLTFKGKPINPSERFRVSMVNFLGEGGDGFTTFTQGTDRVMGPVDIEAFEEWIRAVPLRQVPQENRAVDVGK